MSGRAPLLLVARDSSRREIDDFGDSDLFRPLGNTTDVTAFLSDSINRLRRGQLDARVANAMGLSAKCKNRL
jgi:hypothetical protein